MVNTWPFNLVLGLAALVRRPDLLVRDVDPVQPKGYGVGVVLDLDVPAVESLVWTHWLASPSVFYRVLGLPHHPFASPLY